jgi:peptidoglycan hydrolase CwlO-like protein/3D (Asp-Asp-Asp) domain-containing protein
VETSRSIARVVTAAALVVTAAVAASRPATATDLDSLRWRAQAVADEVTALERQLAPLRAKQERLQTKIDLESEHLAVLEVEIADAREAYEAALDVYVESAVEAYKRGPTNDVELLLSARTLTDLYTLSKAADRVAELHEESLEVLLAAKEAAEAAQQRVDARKQRLLNRQAQARLVADSIEEKVETRREALRELTSEIKALEAEARRRAALAPRPSDAFARILDGSGPSSGIPDGYVSTGVSFEGIASWYGPGFEGNPTANGDIFDPNLYTAASKELPLGSWLYVEHQGRGVVVLVNDRGPYVEGRILDLSQAAAEAIGITGLGWIRAEILIKR